jgi:hypothetical protein
LDFRRGFDAMRGFAVGSRSCSSVFELGNDDRWRPQLRTRQGWLVGGLPWEVGAAGSLASTLGNDDPWQCVVFVLSRVAWDG